uniref:RNase H type-1 domain-containing protein n=1 Tax=Hordeum vulgare subsp. vulgare TaxID=112509 RepID=A0A8I7BAR9_HORVV
MHSFSSTISIRRETSKSNQKWSPSPEGSTLVNVEATILFQSVRAGFVVAICDHQGRIHATNRGYFERVQIPEVAQDMALHQGLILANNTGIRKIMIVSNCLSLINKVKGLCFDRLLVGAIVHDIGKCVTKFVSCTFIHVSRACNEATHVLSKSA